ncbi:MAG TPA: CRTAC1 family protein, partial [Pyrinomonadaceae bacterium]|nr:CRTAC1 family protein [Pyrinomonadaceae bacterium]
KLEAPVFKSAPADTAITFKVEQVAGADQGDWIGAISLSGEGAPVIATATAREVHLASGASLPFPGGQSNTRPGTHSILPVDFNYDFKTDLVLTGDGGVRFFRQDSPSVFKDVTSETKLPAAILNKSTESAWSADIEADGDLDIVLSAAYSVPTVLRNNGDGSFTEIQPFPNIEGLRDFAWADLDADGDPDAAIIDGPLQLHVFSNERQGQFTERAVPGPVLANAIAVMDVDNDGVLDLLAVQSGGAIMRLSDKDHGLDWVRTEIAKLPKPPNFSISGPLNFEIADVDNNGGLDLLILSSYPPPIPVNCAPPCNAGALIWLNDGNGKFNLMENPAWSERVFDVADVNNDGRLDLLGVTREGRPLQAINQGSKNYHWQIVRPRASNAVGDQRINPFGVGGEMEIRSGLLVQKQPITGPMLHFGLGEQTSADVIRVTWPNGTVRADFEVKADQDVVTEQRLKGSCPFLFAYNGKQMEFVKDAVPWGSAIGLRINTLGTASVAATEEWYKIGREQLVPRDGYYDLRITAELW